VNSLAPTTLAVALATGALAAPAFADTPRDVPDSQTTHAGAVYSLDLGSNVRWFGDTSAAIVSEDALAGFRATLGRSLTSTTVRRRDVDIGLYARWAYGVTSGQMFDDLETSLDQHLLGAGIRFDAPLVRRVAMVGQAELGMARTALTVTRLDMTPVDDHAWAPYAQASLGGDLTIADRKGFRLALGVDVGYLVAVPVELHALPGDRPEEDLSIATEFAGIGKLDTRGWTYAMTLRGSY